MMKNKRALLSISLITLMSGLAISQMPKDFSATFAAGTVTVQGSYCSTSADLFQDVLFFEMLPNDAPFRGDEIRYRPQSNDCVSITRDGVTTNLSTNRGWDMIAKTSETRYTLETWMMGVLGDYKPRHGDIYTIKGNFTSRDTTGDDSDNIDGKYILNIKETSFIIHKDSTKTRMIALPQILNDGGIPTMPLDAEQQREFMFDLNDLDQSEAPVTTDTYGYYPATQDNVYIDGNPVADIETFALQRRDDSGHSFYVCSENQGWDELIDVDSLVVFDGTFIYRGENPLEDNKTLGFTLHEAAFHKYGKNPDDYEVVDLRNFLINKIKADYIVDYYKEADKAAIRAIIDNLENDFAVATNAKEVYEVYNDRVATLDSFELDPEAAADYLRELKENAIDELNNYVDLNDYFEEQQNTIIGYINDAIAVINSATNKKTITDAVKLAERNIDTVKVKRTVMVETVEQHLDGYEQYLATYNRVSLNDLGIGDLDYDENIVQRQKEFNTNQEDNCSENMFAPVSGNAKGNVVFQFKYTSHATPKGGGNVNVVLRGIPYYGYKFALDTSTRGCYVNVISNDYGQWYAGTSYIFPKDQECVVEVGALDLIEFDLTWLFIRVNGNYGFSKIVDSLGICVNPRVAIAPNDDNQAYNTYEGHVQVSNYSDGVVVDDSNYFGMLTYSNKSENSNTLICAQMELNDLPYNTEDGGAKFAPLANSSIRIRKNGGVVLDIGNPTQQSLVKYTEKDYRIRIPSDVVVEDGDQIIVDGPFAFYNDETNQKEAFIIGKSVFIYHASTNNWEQTFDLDDAKADACMKLERCVDFSKYDEDDVALMQEIITNGKAQIEACSSLEEINNLMNELLAQIAQFKTSFRKVQDLAIDVVRNYKNDALDQYREDEVLDIQDLKEDAISDINEATTVEEIDAIVEKFKANVDELKTDAIYAKEELEDTRVSAIKQVQDHYALLDINNMSVEAKAKLDEDTKQVIRDIKNAETIDEINSLLNNYLNSYKLKEVKNNQLSWQIIVFAIILPALVVCGGAVALAIFISKRKKG